MHSARLYLDAFRHPPPLFPFSKHIWLSYNFSIKEKLVNIPGGSFSISLDAKSMQKPFTLIVYQRRYKWASTCQWENHIDITKINHRASKMKQFYMVSFLAILQNSSYFRRLNRRNNLIFSTLASGRNPLNPAI